MLFTPIYVLTSVLNVQLSLVIGVTEQAFFPTFTLGDVETCKMNVPIGLAVVNDTIYIGEQSGRSGTDRRRRGHVLKLPYCMYPHE